MTEEPHLARREDPKALWPKIETKKISMSPCPCSANNSWVRQLTAQPDTLRLNRGDKNDIGVGD